MEIVLTVAVVLIVAFIGVWPVWCYHRGVSRQSPIPAVPKAIQNLITPPPQPPTPEHPCLFCKSTEGYVLKGDKWQCKKRQCQKQIPVKPEPIRS